MTAMLVFLALFVVAVLYISYKTGTEPSTLVASVFAFCGVEGGCLALIKSVETTSDKKKSTKKKKQG
jgi:hypothetical protein